MMNEDEIDDKCIRLGRGQTNYNHAGNKKFRGLIAARISVYRTAKKPEKTQLIDEVVKQMLDEGLKFVSKQDDGIWKVLASEAADIRKKVAHRFRDEEKKESKAEQLEREHLAVGGNPLMHSASVAGGLPPQGSDSSYPKILDESGFMTNHRSDLIADGALDSASDVLRDTIRALKSVDLMTNSAAASQLKSEIPSTTSLFGGNNFPQFPNNLQVPDEPAIAAQFPAMGVGDEALSKILGEVDKLVEVSTSIGNNNAFVPIESDYKGEESKQEEEEAEKVEL